MNTEKRPTLWTRDFTTITVATALGALGNIAGGFALSFLVYEETSSTLAAALIVALRLIPGFFIPMFISPVMDRLPRKPFLVGGDLCASVVYVLAGLWLRGNEFNYIYYLIFSLVISSLGSFDELSFNALYPRIIPEGMEEKGYSVSSMLYPAMMTIMTPLSAILYKAIGVANILIIQGGMSFLAAVIESRVQVREEIREGTRFSLSQWWGDIKETAAYLKGEDGLRAMIWYSSTTNGMSTGYEPIWVAFFSTTPGFTIAMYSFFTVVQMIGRFIGGLIIYKKEMPREKKYGYALFIYLFYDVMDALLLWLSYPLMLVNRTICGFLGIQSGTMRYAAVQKYIPDSMRARMNAFSSICYLAFSAVLSLLVGWMGDVMDSRVVMTVSSIAIIVVCLLTIVRRRESVNRIYMSEGMNSK